MNRTAFCFSVLLVVYSCGYSATAIAEIVANGTVYQNGSESTVGFPDFLDNANATTRAANFDGTAQTINFVSLQACPTSGITGFVTLSGWGGITGTLDWVNDSQRTAKNAISNTGMYTGGSATMSIAATAGTQYNVELLSCTLGGDRDFNVDVSLNGGSTYTRYVTNLYVPGSGDTASTVYKFDVVAGSQGIVIRDTNGGTGVATYVNPYWCAMAITAVPEPNALLMLVLGISGFLAYAWRRQK